MEETQKTPTGERERERGREREERERERERGQEKERGKERDKKKSKDKDKKDKKAEDNDSISISSKIELSASTGGAMRVTMVEKEIEEKHENDSAGQVDISAFVGEPKSANMGTSTINNKAVSSSIDGESSSTATEEQTGVGRLLRGCRSIDMYQRLSFIDQGTYGAVFRARCLESGRVVAIKQVKLDANTSYIGFPLAALREINILLTLRHPNIISVAEMVVGSSVDKIYMVMDYYDNDLKYCMGQKKNPFTLGDVKQLMIQLLSAVEHMHSKWYIHRDLKTSNLLYSNSGKLCVCDFGLARKYGSPLVPYTHEVVSLYYRAPEILLGNSSTTYSTPADMWSVACIFAELIRGEVLFQGEGEINQIVKIFRCLGVPTEETWPGFSTYPLALRVQQYKIQQTERLRDFFPPTNFSGGAYLNDSGFDLLSRLLTYNPDRRLTASDALKHAWFSENPRPTAPENLPKFKSRHEDEE